MVSIDSYPLFGLSPEQMNLFSLPFILPFHHPSICPPIQSIKDSHESSSSYMTCHPSDHSPVHQVFLSDSASIHQSILRLHILSRYLFILGEIWGIYISAHVKRPYRQVLEPDIILMCNFLPLQAVWMPNSSSVLISPLKSSLKKS